MRHFASGTASLRSFPSRGRRGGRRSGDVVGAGARQDQAAARAPAPESEWSLPRGEGDLSSFFSGRETPRARDHVSTVAPTLVLVGPAGVTAADLAGGHDQVRRAWRGEAVAGRDASGAGSGAGLPWDAGVGARARPLGRVGAAPGAELPRGRRAGRPLPPRQDSGEQVRAGRTLAVPAGVGAGSGGSTAGRPPPCPVLGRAPAATPSPRPSPGARSWSGAA